MRLAAVLAATIPTLGTARVSRAVPGVPPSTSSAPLIHFLASFLGVRSGQRDAGRTQPRRLRYPARLLALALLAGGQLRAEVPPYVIAPTVAEGRVHGEADLFAATDQGIAVTWDSSRTNSYFYFPLGVTLTRADRFTVGFELRLDEIAIGVTPGKPYTFQIAAGLIGMESAFDPEMLRGTGVNPAHGPRNLVEWNYFPDSGFGATVAPTVATEANQIAFSSNHPLELVPGETYRFELSFDPVEQTLRSRMWQGSSESVVLKDLVLSSTFADFRVDALAVSSYSDAGQNPQFSGSIRAKGLVRALEAVLYDRPQLEINADSVRFETSSGWTYQLEETVDLETWKAFMEPLIGTGNPVSVPLSDSEERSRVFRVRAERSP